ncbi:proton-coupled amino acid transporter-like protein CG1139 isoform X2 [Trichoplusia ni]|uniref:Proton-coupled amino acid transporter-like protein CG1139 isoform X2 n=1 Tax=Trichoplusia ni TaxID=7111 RepID=A0A7E5WPG6_TRINI|nr:proton-coupled amino acid transporter-like protein CG1139 isoform X2 [Trichoplusia ni]
MILSKNIFQYMVGMVDLIGGGENEENYDPHAHRKVPKPTTYGETMMHMLKGSMGAGMLAMPDAVRRMGIIMGAIGIISIGLFSTYCIQLLVYAEYKVCKKMKRGYVKFPKGMKVAIQSGPECMRWSGVLFYQLVDIFLIMWQIGVCAIYFVFVSENVKQVLDFYGIEYSVRFLICCCFPILLVLSWVKDLKFLSPISSFSNVLIGLGLILVFFYLIQEELIVDDEKYRSQGIEEFPVFVGITLFALEAVGVVLALEYNMEKPKEFTGLFGLFSIGMFIIVSIFASLGVLGYLKYGQDIRASITLNLPYDEKKAQAAKLAFAAALFLSFPLQNFVAYHIIWQKTRKRIKSFVFIIDSCLRFGLVLIPFSMAVAAPSLGPFMGLIGALSLTMVAIVFPGIMDLCLHWPKNFGLCYYKFTRDVLIIIVGTFSMVSGVYTSLLEIYEHMNEQQPVPAPGEE